MYEYDPTRFRARLRARFRLPRRGRPQRRPLRRPARAERGRGRARTWTYAELWRDVERLAGEFAARGVRPGETVVFQLFNGPEFALCWLAALRLGAVATPINFRLSAGETAHVLDDSRPAAFIFDAELGAGGARGARARVPRAGLDRASPGRRGLRRAPRHRRRAAAAPRPRRLRRDDPPLHLGHDRAAEGRLAERRGRGDERPRRDHALPARRPTTAPST